MRARLHFRDRWRRLPLLIRMSLSSIFIRTRIFLEMLERDSPPRKTARGIAARDSMLRTSRIIDRSAVQSRASTEILREPEMAPCSLAHMRDDISARLKAFWV